jgi:hypothetical protein
MVQKAPHSQYERLLGILTGLDVKDSALLFRPVAGGNTGHSCAGGLDLRVECLTQGLAWADTLSLGCTHTSAVTYLSQ